MIADIRGKMSIKVEVVEKLSGHKGAIFALEQGETPNVFYSGGGNGMLIKWDLDNTHTATLIAQVPSNIFAIQYIPKFQLLAVGSLQGILYFIDLTNNKLIEPSLKFDKTIYDFLLLDDRLLILDGSGLLSVFDLSVFKTTRFIKVSNKNLRRIAFNQKDTLAVGTSDSAIYFFDKNLEIKQKAKKHEGSVFTVQFLNEQTLLAGSRDAHFSVWKQQNDNKHNKDDWENKAYITGHLFTINDIAIHPQQLDSPFFATASRDKSIRIWESESNKLLKVLNFEKYHTHTHSINSLLWTRHKNYLLSASDDRGIFVWKVG